MAPRITSHMGVQKCEDCGRCWCRSGVFKNGSYYIPNLEIGLTAGVTGRQGILNPPGHLIPILIYSVICISQKRLITVHYLCHFIEDSFNKSINQFHLCSKHDIFGKFSTFHSHENASVPHSPQQVVPPGVTYSKLSFYCLFGRKTIPRTWYLLL
jgi:hypothetical protein